MDDIDRSSIMHLSSHKTILTDSKTGVAWDTNVMDHG